MDLSRFSMEMLQPCFRHVTLECVETTFNIGLTKNIHYYVTRITIYHTNLLFVLQKVFSALDTIEWLVPLF